MIHPRILLFLSALCYTLPFITPYTCWWLIFLFPALLFIALNTHKLHWLDYCAWGLFVSFMHILPLCDAMLYMTSGSIVLRLVPATALVVYVALYPITWLLATHSLLKQCTAFSKKLFFWTISLWIYLLVVAYALFWFFGRCEGFVFANPLLPLAAHPTLLGVLHWVSLPFALLMYCITTSTFTCCIIQRTRIAIVFLILSLIPWMFPIFLHQSTKSPIWLSQIGHLPIMLPETISLERGATLICFELKQLKKEHPDLQLVILPESAWNGTACTSIATIAPLQASSIPDVIIGSFAQERDLRFNSLYWFHHGIRKQRIDKQHAVPFIERIPPGAAYLCNSLFFTKNAPITPASSTRRKIYINDQLIFVPYICSDLFCNNHPDQHFHNPILASCSDWWFRLSYFRQLMVLAARFRAIQWHNPLLYIAFHHAQYFDQYGTAHSIATTPRDRFLN